MTYDIEQIKSWCAVPGGVNPSVVLDLCNEILETRREFIEVLRRACICTGTETFCDFCHLRQKYESKK